MADFGVMKITNLGMALYNKSLTGTQIQFTKLQSGSGELPEGTIVEELTGLINVEFDIAINSISIDEGNNQVKITGIKDNVGLVDGIIAREIGLFANDPDEGEILYSYANAGELYDFIPPETSGAYSKTFQINAAVGNASNVTAVIPADTYVTVESFENKVGDLSNFTHDNLTDEVNYAKSIVRQTKNLILLSSNWVDDTATSGFWIYDIANADSTEDSIVDVNIHLSSLDDSIDIKSVTQSFNGSYRLYADVRPSTDIVCDVLITTPLGGGD